MGAMRMRVNREEAEQQQDSTMLSVMWQSQN